MSYHAGTIHTVRFSSDGKYIASGADDKLVIVYRLDPNAALQQSTFGKSLRQAQMRKTDGMAQAQMKHLKLKRGRYIEDL